jgi:hypothetical protein
MKRRYFKKKVNKALAVLIAVFVLLLFSNAMAQENARPQLPDSVKYQALYLGKDNSNFHIILIVNTTTGKIERRIFYDDANDHQDIFDFVTKEITTITRTKEKKYEAK